MGWVIKQDNGIAKKAPIVVNPLITSVMFKIWRGEPVTGKLVCSVLDGGESKSAIYKVTSFEHVDAGFRESWNAVYTLTAQLASGFGAEIDAIITWGHTRLPETDFRLITQESPRFICGECQ